MKLSPANRRRGMVIVVVLIVIAMLSLAGFTFAEIMFTENKAARLGGRDLQARQLSESGALCVAAMLDLSSEARSELGGVYDNPEELAAVAVLAPDETQSAHGRFSIVTYEADDSESGRIRFGVENESARLNLHKLLEWDRSHPGHAQATLARLPGMTPELADALLDYVDADDTPRELGAESEFYAQQEPARMAANRVPSSLEELLAVRDVSQELLFGLDLNCNGRLEPFEMSRMSSAAAGALSPAVTVRGWSEYLTLDSAEGNLTPERQPRINLNDPNLVDLHSRLSAALDEDWATFIVAMRQFGPAPGGGAARRQAGVQLDFSRPALHTIASVYDLIGARTALAEPGRVSPTPVDSPLAADSSKLATELPRLLDVVTTRTEPRIVGRVNINLAPREVLLGVPGIDDMLADEIVSKRASLYDPTSPGDQRHAAWLFLEGLVTLDRLKTLEPMITGGGDVFRGQVVGFFDEFSASSRAEFVIDATSAPSRLLCWKGLKHLGRGYTLAELGAAPSVQPTSAGTAPVASR
ncbi:MAG: general secretion pathway protein GspK [Pirellulales bacterium]|nr:general secretion pathway protein GspK [Pirellulales bacterium]